MRQKHKYGTEPICRIDVSGFLAIQIVLLVLFLVKANDKPDLPMVRHDDPKVFRPQPMSHANREDAIIVSVDRNGDIWLGSIQSSVRRLPMEIQDAVGHGSEPKVYVHADPLARYSDVRAVLSAVRSAGIENVAFFAHEQLRR